MNPKLIENVVIGSPLVAAKEILSIDGEDWLEQEPKTIFTNERFLPKILVMLEMFKSNSDVKRNRPELFVNLETVGCMELKIGRRRLYIVVGESE